MKNFINPAIINKPRQDLLKFYWLNGAIYLAETDYLPEQNGFLGPEAFAYEMTKERSIDIDSDMDFKLATLLIEKQS